MGLREWGSPSPRTNLSKLWMLHFLFSVAAWVRGIQSNSNSHIIKGTPPRPWVPGPSSSVMWWSSVSGNMQGYRTRAFQNFAVLRRQVEDESRRWERMKDGISWSNVVSQHSCLQSGAYPPLNFSFHVSPALNVLCCVVRNIRINVPWD